MHKALRRALLSLAVVPAVTLAAAAAAVPAGAATASVAPGTTGPNMYSPAEAGYAATQNSFRFVKADFILRDPALLKNYLSRVEYTVEYWSASYVAVLGAYARTSDTSARPWHIEAKVYSSKTHKLICATSAARHRCPGIVAGSHWSATYAIGDKMTLTSLFSKSTGKVRFNANDATTSMASNDYYKTGGSFGQARIGAEFGCTPWTGCGPGGTISYTRPSSPVILMRADDAELSVMPHGLIGFAGPFVHSKVIMTSNGKRTGTKLAYPLHLSQDLTENGVTYHSDSPDGEFQVALP